MSDPVSPRSAYGDPRAVSVRWNIPPDGNGKTPAEALAWKVRRLGLERAHSVVAAGDMRVVDGDTTRVPASDEKLAKGTLIELWRLSPDDPEDILEPPTILHHGAGVLVVDKPGNLAVHPTARYLHATLTSWLRRNGTPANPCHRLDRETSGVLVCADDGVVERRWKQGFAAGRVHKQYLAVVDGVVDSERRIELPLLLQGERGLVRIKMIVDDKGAASSTRIVPEGVSADGRRSLVRCFPETGRQHQIRAHLAAIGHPIVGDKIYQMGEAWFDAFTRHALSDDDAALLPSPRHCLHAARIDFDGDSWQAPTPAVFATAMGR